ncbi:SDR family oxidoreductase [Pararhizobium capsulatum]|uniref:SDR family oxidoreductase n=1 Tax=Pararhizobium capsulatum TaxID=34014 RepID=UPI0035224285
MQPSPSTPAWTKTRIVRKGSGPDTQSSIIQRTASVEKIANLVTYLASPLASATTGASMRVDGGLNDTL